MNDFSLMLPTQQTIAVSDYIDFIPHLQHSKPLGSSRFSKTVKCLSPSGSVVVKLLVKPASHEIDLSVPLKRYEEMRLKLEGVPNVLPYSEVIDTDRAAYLIRDYVRYNLLDRLSIRPFLELIEKKWIIYQLLYALSRIHEKGVCHGDIKSDNILLTSWNWAMLTDFAHLKPVYLPDYNQSQYSFYFDTNHRHACYVAPERFQSKENLDMLYSKPTNLQPAMDIFSLGCAIVELFTDGIPIFSSSQIFKYRKGEYTPNLDAIDDTQIKNMIKSMISLNPQHRLSAKDYLLKFRKSIFPDHFYTFLHPYIKSLTSDETMFEGSDIKKQTDKFHLCNLRIDKIWSDFDKIALYLGFKGQLMKADSDENPKKHSIIPIELNLPGMKRHIPQSTSKIFTDNTNNDCASLIFLSLVIYNVRNTTHSAYRSKASDLILAFAEQLPDEAKFDRCLPYLANMLDDPSEELQSVALKSVTQLLLMVDVITPINVYVFPEYLLPKLHFLLKRSYTASTTENDTSSSKIYLENSLNTVSSDGVKFDTYSNGSSIRMVFACCLPYLASTAKRFYKLSKLLQSNVATFKDPDIDAIGDSSVDFDYKDLEVQFESFTRRILTDNDALVKISLMKNIIPLCSFFSKDKINEVILSHLITYLNDKNSQLKLAFIQSILPISIFVGPTSVEQYILPLLIQTLYDPNELIVIELLVTLKKFVDLGMIRKSCYYDLIDLTVKLTLHPNEQIRGCVLSLILSIGNQLSLAELYCMVYPLIRPYFQHEINDFSWKNLYLTVHSQLSRECYNFIRTWANTKEQTLFWQRFSLNDHNTKMDSFGNTKLVFMKKQRGANALNKSTLLAATNDVVLNSEIPLNKEDLKSIEKLIAMGLKENDVWKVATMRSYIYKVVKLESKDNAHILSWDSKVNLMARSVFVDVRYEFQDKVEDKNSNAQDAENSTAKPPNFLPSSSNKPASAPFPASPVTPSPAKIFSPTIDETIALNEGSPVFLLPNLKQNKPYIGEDKTFAVGETSSVFSALSGSGSGNTKRGPNGFEDTNHQNVIDGTLNQKALVTRVNHTYPGYNPFILKFLESLQFTSDLDIYSEFGPTIDRSRISNVVKSSENKLINTLMEHKDSITTMDVSPDSKYFVTGDDGGFVKIWEASRLELDITGDSCLSFNLSSCIRHIKFIPEKNCFVVATANGSIKIFRVNFVDSLNKSKANKYKETSVELVRKFKMNLVNGVSITYLNVSVVKDKPFIFVATSSGKMIIVDIRTMEEVKVLQNDALHGVPLCVAIDKNQYWLIIGTSRGILDLWDIEAGICVKSVKFKAFTYPITSIEVMNESFELYGKKGKFVAFVGGTGQSDVIIWDVERMIPRIALCSNSVLSKIGGGESYSVMNVDDEVESKMFDMWNDNSNNESSTSLFVSADGRLISSSHDKRIISWDLHDFKQSKSINDPSPMIYNEVVVSSTLAIVNETHASDKKKSHINTDKITALCSLLQPFEMMISADRCGKIRIYR